MPSAMNAKPNVCARRPPPPSTAHATTSRRPKPRSTASPHSRRHHSQLARRPSFGTAMRMMSHVAKANTAYAR